MKSGGTIHVKYQTIELFEQESEHRGARRGSEAKLREQKEGKKSTT
jgi:hypothetical protein